MASLTDLVASWMTLAAMQKLAGLIGISGTEIMFNSLAGTFEPPAARPFPSIGDRLLDRSSEDHWGFAQKRHRTSTRPHGYTGLGMSQ